MVEKDSGDSSPARTDGHLEGSALRNPSPHPNLAPCELSVVCLTASSSDAQFPLRSSSCPLIRQLYVQSVRKPQCIIGP